ncbi:MAG: DUF3025 domain-containing protein [Xanthomonadales bacterium PRO7]|jgi:hypothetical protein|nr:DUF3025 domain-containing protein [Xanthomonadales bacterium PRO7]HMM58166.1 DUF3025 domain-containing protein [Rudaea sp.]
MRFVAPAREAVDADVFARPPLSHWSKFEDLLRGGWPDVALLNACRPDTSFRFVAQTPELLADGKHYEQRIFERSEIATRERNWHDLLNALVWLRFPEIKRALNARQVAEIAKAGPKQRTRAQCALTHFDEGGVVVVVRDPQLLTSWDAHDWHGLFWRERGAWSDGRIEIVVFGHALLEHALEPAQLLVGKCIAVMHQSGNVESAMQAVAAAIGRSEILNDPQELRPLPLSGIPGWHPDNGHEDFYRSAACFRPLRAGRVYAPPLSVAWS